MFTQDQIDEFNTTGILYVEKNYYSLKFIKSDDKVVLLIADTYLDQSDPLIYRTVGDFDTLELAYAAFKEKYVVMRASKPYVYPVIGFTEKELNDFNNNGKVTKLFKDMYLIRFYSYTLSDKSIKVAVELASLVPTSSHGWLSLGTEDDLVAALKFATEYIDSIDKQSINVQMQNIDLKAMVANEIQQINLEASISKSIKEYFSEKLNFDFFERTFTKIVNSIVYKGHYTIDSTVVKAFKDGVKEATKESLDKLQKT